MAPTSTSTSGIRRPNRAPSRASFAIFADRSMTFVGTQP
jgi:hypothetical protein